MNTIKKYPAVGDIAILVDGKMRFVGQDATKEFIDKQQAIGVVYFTQGSHVKLVGGQNDQTKPWSCVCDFEITEIPKTTGPCAVKLQDQALGDFTYTKTAGTKEEFVSQLNEWLKTNANKWEAYMDGAKAILQLSDYSSYEANNSIAGCTLAKRVGSEVAQFDVIHSRNSIKQKVAFNGVCRARLEEYCRSASEEGNNPETAVDGVTKLFEVYPCSEAYYNGEKGINLRKYYPTYEDYMDACMVRAQEVDNGVMAYHDGRILCDLLKGKKVTVRGVQKPAYEAVDWAENYDSGVQGYGKGVWHLPSMSENALLMRGITNGTKKPADPITTALGKKTGWSPISSAAHRWSCVRSYVNNAWYCYSRGFAYCWGEFHHRFGVSAVSAFDLDFNN